MNIQQPHTPHCRHICTVLGFLEMRLQEEQQQGTETIKPSSSGTISLCVCVQEVTEFNAYLVVLYLSQCNLPLSEHLLCL